MSAEIVRREAEGAVTVQPPSIITIIEKLTNSPSLTLEGVQAVRELVALQREQEVQRRQDSFFDALARVQARAPRIKKNGLMDRGAGKGQIPYAKLEDVDAVMRPIYQEEGFSVTWDFPQQDGKIKVVGSFTACGHTEKREWSCVADNSGGKQPPQAAVSTGSYGRRILSIGFWNIITEDEDINGAKPEEIECIPLNAALDIRTRMNDLPQSKPGNLLAKLCVKYGVAKPEDIKIGQYSAVAVDVANTERAKAAK